MGLSSHPGDLGQQSPLLGLSLPSPKQTGYSEHQVSGLLGEQSLESSLIRGCVWCNPSRAVTPGVGRGSAGGLLAVAAIRRRCSQGTASPPSHVSVGL